MASISKPKAQRFVVAKGSAITTLERGIIADGADVSAADLQGKQEALTDLVARGIVVPYTEPKPEESAKSPEAPDGQG